MKEVFKKAGISEVLDIDGENLTNLRFANDVALFSEKKQQQMEKKHLIFKQSELSLKAGLKIPK